MAEPSLPLNEYCTVPATNMKIGPWGAPEVFSFDFGQSSSRIIKVQLYTGVVVDSLTITYAVGQETLTTNKAGGPGGGLQEFVLLDNEYINSIVGAVDTFDGETCITMLKFKTNLGNEYGPFGEGSGEGFTISVADNRIVGFYGQYTKYINMIGVYVASSN